MLDIILTIENDEERITAEQIWTRYHLNMYFTALKILKNQNDAEDAMMDAVKNIVRNIGKFVGLNETDVVCLVTIYVKHAAFKIYNKNKSVSEYMIDNDNTDLADVRTSTENKIITKHDYEKLSVYLKNMPETYSHPFILRHYYGWSIKDIMKSLELTEAAVKKRLVRAKQQLLELMENDNG